MPFYDLEVAAGDFGALHSQLDDEKEWVAIPDHVRVSKNLFACRVMGESMNRIIPNGSTCLFRKAPGGTRNGKIVLVECTDEADAQTGSRYTIKDYDSIKVQNEDGWLHKVIRLNPRSYNDMFQPLELTEAQALCYQVIGEFVQILE